MLDLVTNHYASATSSGVSTDPQTGQTSITTDARNQLEDAVAAWEDYLKTKPQAAEPVRGRERGAGLRAAQ